MATTTIDTDTDLSAVNSILGAIGQSPVTTLNYENPEISYIFNILTEVNKDVQNEGWHFNKEYHVKLSPDNNKHVVLPPNTLRYDLHADAIDKSQDLVIRKDTTDGQFKFYDLVDHTYEFTDDIYVDVTTLYKFDELPNAFQRYITYRSAVRAATQLVSNPQLVQLLQQDEAKSRAACMEYECSIGDHNFLGHPHESYYSSYKPYRALRR